MIDAEAGASMSLDENRTRFAAATAALLAEFYAYLARCWPAQPLMVDQCHLESNLVDDARSRSLERLWNGFGTSAGETGRVEATAAGRACTRDSRNGR